MRNRQSAREMGGIAIAVAVLTLGLGVFFLADLRAMFERHITIYAVFPQAPRLRIGSPVWIGGHRVGRVTNIGFRSVQPDSVPSIAVSLEIPREHLELVRQNSSTVRLTSARLIGEPVVDITPGHAADPMLHAGDTLFGPRQTGRAQLGQSLHAFQRSLDTLMATRRRLTPLIDARQADFAQLATRVDRLQDDFGNLRTEMNGGSLDLLLNQDRLQRAFGALGHTAQQLGPSFSAAAANYSDPKLRLAFAQLQNRAQSVSTQLRQTSALIANGSLPRFSQDSALSKSLRLVQVELDSLIAETRRNPLRYWLGNSRRGVEEPLRRQKR